MWYIWFLACVLSVNAAVTEVTVYPQGATLHEQKTLQLKPGANELVWGDLSPSVDEGSLRVELPTGVRLVDRQVQSVQLAQEQNTQRAALEKQLRDAQAILQNVQDKLEIIQKSERYVDGIQTASTSPVKGEAAYAFPLPEQWEKLIEFVKMKRADLLKERRGTEEALRLATAEVERISRQINDLNNSPLQYVQRLTLKLEALKAANEVVSVSYFDSNAGWQPTYQVWVDSASKAVKLNYAAEVRQSTDKSWEGVAVTLSTARPQSNATAPELSPWWVSELKPEPVRAYAKSARAEAVMMSMTAMDNSAAPAAGFAEVQVSQQLSFAEFKIPGKHTIPADNAEHKLILTELPLQGELVYAILPELSTQAYLQAKVTNNSDFTLLPGATVLYADGNYVGRSHMKLIQPAESFELNLGADPALKVERKAIAKKTDRTGVMDTSEKITYAYEITLTNLKATAQKAELYERIPLSQHEKIKVQLLEPKELAKQVDKEGKLKWSLQLQPQEKKTITLSYSVEYPKAMQVDGI